MHNPHTFPHGICECRQGCTCKDDPGPAAISIERDNQMVNICTKCHNHTDKLLSVLITPSTNPEVFLEYDHLGTHEVVRLLQAKMAATAIPKNVN